MPGDNTGSYSGGTNKFWEEYSIKDERDQPGNPKADGEVSPAKAKEILKHGSVKGHKLTPKQEGFFGARAGGAPYKKGE